MMDPAIRAIDDGISLTGLTHCADRARTSRPMTGSLALSL